MGALKHQTPPTTVPVTSDGLRRNQLALEALIAASGAAGVLTFNTRSGAVTLLLEDVLTALGYTPVAEGPQMLNLSIVDLPTTDVTEPLFRHRVRDVSWTFSAAGSFADASVAATGSPVLRIRKNGAQVGTVTYAGTTGTVAFTTSAFATNDLLEIYPPATADATLDQLSVSLSVTIV